MELVLSARMPLTLQGRRHARWVFSSLLPARWGEDLRDLGGGFFHTPPGIRVGAPEGEPLYAHYLVDGAVRALALGVRYRCRLSGHHRHAYFPTWPLFRDPAERALALTRLSAALQVAGIAEVRWDSFDSGATTPPARGQTRWEYLVDLPGIGDAASWPAAPHHRRAVRRGEREGLSLRILEPATAALALHTVMGEVRDRIARRGAKANVVVPSAVTAPAPASSDWAVTTFAAMRGDELHAAALVGEAGSGAYYVMGGATPQGYAIGASTWLHAQVAAYLARQGRTHYNLGGTPVGAESADDPANGLHRFKLGFGARILACAGDRWILRPAHWHGHRMLEWASQWVL